MKRLGDIWFIFDVGKCKNLSFTGKVTTYLLEGVEFPIKRKVQITEIQMNEQEPELHCHVPHCRGLYRYTNSAST